MARAATRNATRADQTVSGAIFGLGVGPGDPELLTLKALRLLRTATLVVYPAPETGPSLTRSIVAPHLDGSQEEMAIRIPMTAARFPAQSVYDRAASEIAARAAEGDSVAVLCEGDPFFYGSFMYLFARLAEQAPVEVVPGVSSLTAAATRLGAPLAARNDVLSVIPAGLPEDDIIRRLQCADAAAIIKVGAHFAKLRRTLGALGLDDQAHYISHATMDRENTAPLDRVDPASVPYFSMILIHKRGAAWQ